MAESAGQVIVFRTDDGRTQVQLRAVNGTVWLSQAHMAALYGTSIPNIAQIVGRILDDDEVPRATVNSELMVRREGSRDVQREITVYNLDMVLAVGYRVTTPRAVQFRQWATTVLTEFLRTGYALDDERLKDPAAADYFDELLARIRDIRASEKRFYQKVRDLFAVSSADYDAADDAAKNFFATIQNKLLYAVTGRTAAELIVERANPEAPSMGLTTWKGDRPRKGDVTVSKNYLAEAELASLNRLTTMFLDFAEDRAERRTTTLMTDWIAQTDQFLAFNERSVLQGPGQVSSDRMTDVVGQRYAEFDAKRREVQAVEATDEEFADLTALVALEHRADRDNQGGEGQ